MARLAGIEPTTPWFVAKYSIQLSYSRVKRKYSTVITWDARNLALRQNALSHRPATALGKIAFENTYDKVAQAIFSVCPLI